VVVLILVISGTMLLVLMGLLPARESARLAGCARNLSQIGFALALYDQMHSHLPRTAAPIPPGVKPANGPAGPLKTLLQALDIPDFRDLRDPKTPPKPQTGLVPGEMPVPGFFCASDPHATAGGLSAPVSYRAATGESQRGANGAFAPGREWSLAAIEARDGLSYTAAFSERLVGASDASQEALPSYWVVASPLPDSGCPVPLDLGGSKHDAGNSWVASDYRSTLYNHALRPNARPSCIAADGATAFMGASSGHVRGVNVLRLDGSVTITLPGIATKVWRDLGAITEPPQGQER
jgi:hypothetical protein